MIRVVWLINYLSKFQALLKLLVSLKENRKINYRGLIDCLGNYVQVYVNRKLLNMKKLYFGQFQKYNNQNNKINSHTLVKYIQFFL